MIKDNTSRCLHCMYSFFLTLETVFSYIKYIPHLHLSFFIFLFLFHLYLTLIATRHFSTISFGSISLQTAFNFITIFDTGSSQHTTSVRNIHQMCSVKKGVLRNFKKLTGNHLCQSLFLRPNNFNFIKKEARKFIKKETLAQVFRCELFKISRNTFFYRTPLDDCF